MRISNGSQLYEDLLNESILIFLEKDNVQDIVDSGGSLFYLIRIMSNQWKSTTSPFHRNYRNYVELPENFDVVEQEVESTEELEKEMEKELEKLHWYGKTLFKIHYFENESIAKISRDTKIPRSSITLEIKRVKEGLYKKGIEYNER